ncbi:hypothetical protein ALISP_2608 [Alicycliphilus sp. B1]|nr:hypothetical protein ALISP_2608 [Alicycliphilus sp. B1]
MDWKIVWIGGAYDLDAVGFHPGLDLHHRFDGIDLERQVLCPGRGVGIRGRDHLGLGGQFEEGQDVAAADVDKDVHVGVGLLGRGHLVFGDGEDEIRVQVLLVPLDGCFSVLAAVSDVVDAIEEGHGCLLGRLKKQAVGGIASA